MAETGQTLSKALGTFLSEMGRRRKLQTEQLEFHWEWENPLIEMDVLPYYAEPGNDNEVLMNAQHDWLLFRTPSAWNTLWSKTVGIARKMTRIRLKKKGVPFDSEMQNDIAMDAALYLLNRYEYFRQEYGRDYVIKTNFISAIHHAVQHSCDYATKADKLVSYVDIEFFDTFTSEGRNLDEA